MCAGLLRYFFSLSHTRPLTHSIFSCSLRFELDHDQWLKSLHSSTKLLHTHITGNRISSKQETEDRTFGCVMFACVDSFFLLISLSVSICLFISPFFSLSFCCSIATLPFAIRVVYSTYEIAHIKNNAMSHVLALHGAHRVNWYKRIRLIRKRHQTSNVVKSARARER